jgi:hypothetical protein
MRVYGKKCGERFIDLTVSTDPDGYPALSPHAGLLNIIQGRNGLHDCVHVMHEIDIEILSMSIP